MRDPLLLAAGSLCRQIDPLDVCSSIQRAAERFQEDDIHVIPVCRDGVYAGVLEEKDLLYALSGDWSGSEAVERILRRDAPSIAPTARGAEALRAFEATRSSYLAVVDHLGGVHGILTPSRLALAPAQRVRPRLIGGMATPFGVYLTNGRVGAGAGPLALLSTGALLFGLYLAATYLVMGLTLLVPGSIAAAPWFQAGAGILALVLFLAGMRSLPLAGIHAAEHKVVHAIEQGEQLEPETVARMPRIHPRCGTNLAAGAMIFMGLFGAAWSPDPELRMLVAFLAAIILWKPVGYLLQKHATTKEPTPRQIQMGIDAGKALLARLETTPSGPPSIFQRLGSSGVFHILLGSALLQAAAFALMALFNVPAAWRPF